MPTLRRGVRRQCASAEIAIVDVRAETDRRASVRRHDDVPRRRRVRALDASAVESGAGRRRAPAAGLMCIKPPVGIRA
jgi:hypothetical protein